MCQCLRRPLLLFSDHMLKLGSRFAFRLLGHDTLNNQMYGHAGVLRRYCGLPFPMPVQGFVQHGWSYGPGIPLEDIELGEISRNLRFRLWNTRNERMCRELGFHDVRIVGAPLLYLPPPSLESLEAQPRSVLFFPGHTAEREPLVGEETRVFSDFLDEINPVSDCFASKTLCLYWREFENPRIRMLAADRGFEVTSLGNRDGSPRFLEDFRSLVLRHEYVSTNEYSTALFYSLYLKRKTFIHGRTFVHCLKPGKTNSQKQFEIMSRKYPGLFWERFNDTSHSEIGAAEIGEEFRLNPVELATELGWTARSQLNSFGKRAMAFLHRKFYRSVR